MWSLFLPSGVAVGNMWHKTDFETAVKEREGLWIRDGGPTDQEWEEYKEYLSKKCGMDDLIQVYQDAYDRYSAAE